MVAPEVAAFAFNAALLVPLAGRAELRGKPPMRAERHEPHRLLPPVAAQDLAHRTGQIVVAQQLKHAAEVGEGVLVRLEERLLRRMQVGPVERRPAGHRAHREHLHLGPLVAEIDPGLIPVDLRLLSPTVALRHARGSNIGRPAGPRVLRQIESVAVEHHHRGIPVVGGVALDGAVLQHQERALVIVDEFAGLRHHGQPFGPVALIVEKNAKQLSVRRPLAEKDGHALFELVEPPRLHDVAHDICAHGGDPVAQHAQTFGGEIRGDRANQQRDDHGDMRKARNKSHGDMPDAFITMISESVASLLSTCTIAIKSAIGASTMISAGITSAVMPMKTKTL